MTAHEASIGRDARNGHQVHVRSAGKRYGSVQALTNIDLDVSPGEFLVLLGPSGSGKSTLLRSLAGVERIDEGEISLSGKLVSDRRRHLPPEQRNLAMVFQDYALWPHLTAAQNVGYALRRRRLPSREHDHAVTGALARVGLDKHSARYPSELSGGEQQRVALARAVVAEPGLLLFDEPLSNLDADLRDRLRVEISLLTRDCGATAVYITHDQSEAFALADRIGVLDHGRLVQLGLPEDIYRHPVTPFVARFTGIAGEMHGVVGSTPDGRRGSVVDVNVGGSRIQARLMADAATGSPVTVLVRPSGLTMGTDATAENVLQGVVSDVAYRGHGFDHVVDSPVGSFHSVHSGERHDRGSRVSFTLEVKRCLAFPATSTSDGRQELNVTTDTVGVPEEEPHLGPQRERETVSQMD